ncbi:MAG: hypothetical protein AAFN11_04990 [Chloroflexota bacterium]
MPHTDQFFEDMAGENRQAALLVAQVGAAPNELQLITQVAEYDESVDGLRPIRSYIIRVLGVLEHRINNFGVTVNEVKLHQAHPLLLEYTEKPTAVFFRGTVANPDSIVMDIAQAHATTFFPYRHFPQYLNTDQSLSALFESGGGLLGQMPTSLANRVIKILEHHNLEYKTAEGDPYIKKHDNPALLQSTVQVLTIGSSYFIGYGFSFQQMQGRNADD